MLEGPAVTAFPNLHALAYGEGGQRLSAELRVEAADALERLSRSCSCCAHADVDPSGVWCNWLHLGFPLRHSCAHWAEPNLTPAHDKEKS